MANDNNQTSLQESIIKKGGVDTKPIVPRPAKAPQGQNPEANDSSQATNDNDD